MKITELVVQLLCFVIPLSMSLAKSKQKPSLSPSVGIAIQAPLDKSGCAHIAHPVKVATAVEADAPHVTKDNGANAAVHNPPEGTLHRTIKVIVVPHPNPVTSDVEVVIFFHNDVLQASSDANSNSVIIFCVCSQLTV